MNAQELFKTGPTIKRGKSDQTYETPKNFIDAVRKRFGEIQCDLAATKYNAKALEYITPEVDSLTVDWAVSCPGLNFLNPPFSEIGPWAEKCAESILEPKCKILLLVPASVGSNWFRNYVFGKAMVLFLNGRITFVDQPDPYPRDLMLACYGFPAGVEIWKWA